MRLFVCFRTCQISDGCWSKDLASYMYPIVPPKAHKAPRMRAGRSAYAGYTMSEIFRQIEENSSALPLLIWFGVMFVCAGLAVMSVIVSKRVVGIS